MSFLSSASSAFDRSWPASLAFGPRCGACHRQRAAMPAVGRAAWLARRRLVAGLWLQRNLRGRPQRWMRFGSFSMTMSESLQLCWMHEWCCFSKAATRPCLSRPFCLKLGASGYRCDAPSPVLLRPPPVACGEFGSSCGVSGKPKLVREPFGTHERGARIWAARAICFSRTEHTHHDPDCRCSARPQKGCPPVSVPRPAVLGVVRPVTAHETKTWSSRLPSWQSSSSTGSPSSPSARRSTWRKTCTPRRQKDGWALRIAYVCMFVLGVTRRHDRRLPAAAAIAGVLLGNAAAPMVGTSSCARCFTPTPPIGADAPAVKALRDPGWVTCHSATSCQRRRAVSICTFQSAAASDPAVSTRPTRTSATAAAFPFNGDACSVGPGASRRAARLSTRARPRTGTARSSPSRS